MTSWSRIAVVVLAAGAWVGCGASGGGNGGGASTGGSSAGGSSGSAGASGGTATRANGGVAGVPGADSGTGGAADSGIGGGGGTDAGGLAGSSSGGAAGSGTAGSGGAAGAGGSGVLDTIHCPANGVLFERLGLVHAPTSNDPSGAAYAVSFHPPPGTYAEVRLQVDVYAPGWNDPTSGYRYSLFWFARNAKNLDLFGYGFLAAHSTVVLRNGIGITAGNKPKITMSANLPMPATYHVAYRYDMAGGHAELDLTRGPSRTPVAQLKNVPNVTSISIAANGTLDVGLGNNGTTSQYYNPQEPPQYGWKWSNLRVCAIAQ